METMTQEDKELLLKDLCARLPYGVKIALKNDGTYHHDNVAKKGDITIDKLKSFNGRYFGIYHDNPLDWSWYNSDIGVEDIKPYLFPLSSMTEEQHKEFYDKYCWSDGGDNFEMDSCSHYYALEKFDWLDKNHFDYRGLIPMGLAIDATGLNI